MKRCADCGECKPLDEFPRNRNCKDGRHSVLQAVPQRARQGDRRSGSTAGSRHYHLKRRYGIGADDFDELVAQQGGVCAICGRADPEHVDHDHDTGAVRGILCFNCNGGLGQFRDSIDALLAAAAYLDAHGPHAVELDGRSPAPGRCR